MGGAAAVGVEMGVPCVTQVTLFSGAASATSRNSLMPAVAGVTSSGSNNKQAHWGCSAMLQLLFPAGSEK